MAFPPERIICLTEETVETLYLLGEEKRIVGVSGAQRKSLRPRPTSSSAHGAENASVRSVFAAAKDSTASQPCAGAPCMR